MQPYDFGALALRLMIAAEFFPTGWSTVKDPVGRSKREGMPPAFMIFIGAAEMAGSAGLAFGVLARWAALGFILIMAGGIQKKIFVWHTGFWGKDAYGWHYDLTLATMNLMIALSGPGRLSLYP
ncbi:MAG TPA: DoxX family protein [Gemmatimonadaceae bacterium]|nr:DoxX family protein [Gemmatimonadaceae bacterium]